MSLSRDLLPPLCEICSEVCRTLVARGQTITIVEQNVRAALSIANRVYVLDEGHIVFEGIPDALHASPEVMNRYLGV